MKNKNRIVLLGIVTLFAMVAMTATVSAAQPAENVVWLEPDDSSVPGYCNTTEVEVWANITDPDGCAGGTINLTYDPGCANVTKWKRNIAVWPLGTWDSSTNGRERITFAVMPPDFPSQTAEVLIGTLTIHCNSTSFCKTPLLFGEGSSLIAKPPGLPSRLLDVEWKNGTFTCGDAQTPDLVIEKKVKVDDGMFIVNYIVTNIGTAPAGESTTCKLVDGKLMESPPCPALKPGESHSGKFDPEVCPCGETVNVTVCADCENDIEESDETNNCEVNFVECEKPSIDVNKTVFDADTGEWMDEINASIGDIVRFRGVIHNDGECPLHRIVVTDFLSDSLEYADNATVDGEPWEPEQVGSNEFVWKFPNLTLLHCENVTIEFDAGVVKCGVDVNVMNASATYGWMPAEQRLMASIPVIYDEDTATVVVPQKPSIEVDKTVLDPKTGKWVDEINASIGDIVRFRCEIHNDGTCCPLTDIIASDILSDSLKYADNATVNGEPWEPIIGSPKEFTWKFPDWILNPCETITIEFNAEVVKCGIDKNVQKVKAACVDTGEVVSDSDTATVVVPGVPDLVVKKKVKFNEDGMFVVSYTVTNIGCGPAGESTICNYVDGEIMEKQPCPKLGYGETYSGRFEPEECPCGETLNVTVCADCGDDVEESNETNNCEVNFVECPCAPSIDVKKTVWNQVTEEWVDKLTAPLGETVTFNSTIHNDGECCNLTNLTITDTLSDSFEYVGHYPNITAEIIKNPDGSTTLIWEIPGPLAPCESLTFLINATLIKTGVDTNVQKATAWCGETMVADEDTASVHSVRPEGGISVSVIPRVNRVNAGSSVNFSIKIKNNENFGDVFLVNLTNESLPSAWRADLSWFNWTSTYVGIPAGGEVQIPLRADVPTGVSSYKAFQAVAKSTKWTSTAFDTGILDIK